MQNFITVFFFITSIILFLILLFRKYKIEEVNNKIKEENEKLEREKIAKETALKYLTEQEQKAISDQKARMAEAAAMYAEILELSYKDAEMEYDNAIDALRYAYDGIQDTLIAKKEEVQKDLDKISATRAAAIQAQLKEEEIQQQEQFYSLSISDIDKREIKILQSIESELRDPRPIRMIIWQTYYSKKANELASRVLGPEEVCGIYKITNKNNRMCYIGQSKKVRERFRDHMKCGLGIDTPANNKLYQAMLKEGLSTFTFELIESCSVENLDEKEYFYINLYNSYHFGYNSNTGIKKP